MLAAGSTMEWIVLVRSVSAYGLTGKALDPIHTGIYIR